MPKLNQKKINAQRKMLEAEVELLEDRISEAIHWNEAHTLRAPLGRIRQLAQDLGNELGLQPFGVNNE